MEYMTYEIELSIDDVFDEFEVEELLENIDKDCILDYVYDKGLDGPVDANGIIERLV